MRYRAYSEDLDKKGYLSYSYDKFTYNLASPIDFRKALDSLKRQAFTSKANLNVLSNLNKVIKGLVEKDDNLSLWCKNKHICLITLFPEYANPEEEVDLPEIIGLFYMMQKSNAIIIGSSLDYLYRFVKILDLAKIKILDELKPRVILDYHQKPLRFAHQSPDAERFVSIFNEISFIESKAAFHTCCANEFHYMSELTIRTLLKTGSTTICNQFFSLLDNQAKTPLIAATLFGMRQAVKCMIQAIQKKIDIRINDKDDQGYTALDYAYLLGYNDLVLSLLSAGAQFSSLSIIKNCLDPSLVGFVFKRAIICPERHCSASHNYLYLNDNNGLPIMVGDAHEQDSGMPSKMRFVIMHPENEDANTLIRNNSSIVNIESLSEFKRLKELPSTKTFAENRQDNLTDPVFLKNLTFLLARLGNCEAVQMLLECHQNEDLLHQEKQLNLLHVCSNSYGLTGNYLNPLVPESFQGILTGRVRLVEFLIKHYPKLKEEMTITSVGEENFASIVERMFQKQQLLQDKLDPLNRFNNSLYTLLRQTFLNLEPSQPTDNLSKEPTF